MRSESAKQAAPRGMWQPASPAGFRRALPASAAERGLPLHCTQPAVVCIHASRHSTLPASPRLTAAQSLPLPHAAVACSYGRPIMANL